MKIQKKIMSHNNIDLHCHSTFSDGILPVKELVEKHIELGTNLFSITDHDNFESMYCVFKNFPELVCSIENYKSFKSGKKSTIYVPGIEISTLSKPVNKKYHLCSYFPFMIEILLTLQKHNGATDYLTDRQKEQLECFNALKKDVDEKRILRIKRSKMIFERLCDEYKLKEIVAPLVFSYDDFVNYCRTVLKFDPYGGETAIGRPHIANYLIEKGLCKDKDEAFNKYLVGANVSLEHFDLEETVKKVADMGGIPILAHPFLMKDNRDDLLKIIHVLCANGLKGLEAYHAEEMEEDTEFLLHLAREHKVALSSGSDYHDSTQEGSLNILGNQPKCSEMASSDQSELINMIFNCYNEALAK